MTSKEVAPQDNAGKVFTWSNARDLPTLELDDLTGEDSASLTARGAAYAREVARIEDASTTLKRNIAVVLIALRKQLDDWRGESYEYRSAVTDMYLKAGIADDEYGTRLKNSVRYHVGNYLRRYLTPRELKRYGLIAESPLERQQDTRATHAAIIRATQVSTLAADSSPAPAPTETTRKGKAPKGEAKADVVEERAPGLRVKASADQLRLASVAAGIVKQVSPEVVDADMTDGQRAKLDEELAEMERTVRRLRRHLKSRRSEG